MATEGTSRERILARIRAAQPAPPTDSPVPNEQIFAPIDDPLVRFVQECAGNLTECMQTANAQESAQAIVKVLASLPAGPMFIQDAPKLRELAATIAPDRPVVWSSEREIPEATQAALTLCEALIAQTGSQLTSSRCAGRGASAVPLCHIVYAHTSQLMPDLRSALRYALESGLIEHESYVGVITGSSRTADIEKILVQGAHGPRRVVIVLEGEGGRL